MARNSSISEKPICDRPRRLVYWLNPTGEKKVHSLVDNGRCHLVNVNLGTELALTVVNPVFLPNGSARYSIEMIGIDDTFNQQWTIVKDGNPAGQIEQFCVEQ
ncbi:MAG: hypothetical protein AB8B79_12395 [Granulosicoccus sp.]